MLAYLKQGLGAEEVVEVDTEARTMEGYSRII